TDGRLTYGRDGEQLKVFDVRDGLAIQLAREAGLKVAILSGRKSAALSARAKDLRLDRLISGRADKRAAFEEFLAGEGIAASSVGAIGDDLPDLPVLLRAGLAFAPADAAPEVRQSVDRVLAKPGGAGAVREMVELLLRALGTWDGLVARFAAP
ncbi:MAG TPA: HAD hydrolase family protein, partial [Thermoanaerobaculia bacterium]|nr:HAD hydrolase family protein [Thermoanaerobaculia bacterium]